MHIRSRVLRLILGVLAVMSLPTVGDRPRSFTQALSAQAVSFENTIGELSNTDPKVRLRAVQLLKGAAYPEAAIPLALNVADANDDVQLDAIAAELNIFLAEKVTPKKRVGFLIEVRGRIAAEPLFDGGSSVLGPLRVPVEVPMALASAAIDKNFRVATEALYAFGTLAGEVKAADRAPLLARTGSLLAGIIAAPDPTLRFAAVRVAGRIFAHRRGDGPIDEAMGDAVIGALNDREDVVREAAMWALGSMQYERSVQALSELFRFYRKGPLAERALDAQARIGHEASLPEFVEQLSGNNLTFKLMAIEGIARTGDRSRAEGIQALLKNERNDTLLLAGHFANVQLSDGSLDTIVDALTRSRLHDQAFQYLQELAFGRAEKLASHTKDPDRQIRLDVTDALGLSGDRAALPVVEPLVQDKDPEVALAARRAVARLSDLPEA